MAETYSGGFRSIEQSSTLRPVVPASNLVGGRSDYSSNSDVEDNEDSTRQISKFYRIVEPL